MGQNLPRTFARIGQLKAKMQDRQPKQDLHLEGTKIVAISTDADFQLRQQCAVAGETAAGSRRCGVYYTKCIGAEISFAYLPEVRMKTQAHRILQISLSFVHSTDLCRLYHELCRRIYAADQTSELAKPGNSESDVCLWITPYVEICIERNMHGVMEKRLVKGSTGTRLRNRTLLVKWMLEISDWQEQLARNFWGLPKHGIGRDVTRPWFSLEVEYRSNGRRKLFDAHRHEFEGRNITWETFSNPDIAAHAGGITIGGEAITETRLAEVIEGEDVVAEAGGIDFSARETAVGGDGGVAVEEVVKKKVIGDSKTAAREARMVAREARVPLKPL